MADQSYSKAKEPIQLTAADAVLIGELRQLADGRAGAYKGSVGISSGNPAGYYTEGQYVVQKTTGFVVLDGMPLYWDYSAAKCYYKPVNDQDFFIGVAVGDATSAATTCTVNLNVKPAYTLDLLNCAIASVLVGTAAAGGLSYPLKMGGSNILELSSTNEAQKVDLLSTEGVSKDANAICEGSFRVYSKGSGSAPDFSLGLASGTHASDADSIAESLFIHLNGNDENIYAESDDGTNEIAATDTTIDFTEGTTYAERVYFAIDMRIPTSVKFYVNYSLVLSGTTFNVNAATGQWKLLAHLEKTAAADTFKVAVDQLTVRTAKQ